MIIFRFIPIFTLVCFCLSIAQAEDLQPLKDALEKQSEHQSVKVTFKQTKHLPALTEEVATSGKLWLIPGKAFRWEVGQPKTKSAVYDGSKVFLMEEQEKTAEELSAKNRKVKPLLLMLGIGEGASFEEMMKSFKVAGTNQVREHFIVSMVPKSGKLKRVMSSLVMQVNIKNSFMERIEWAQKDGTKVITEFSPPTLNQTLPKNIFEVDRAAYQWK